MWCIPWCCVCAVFMHMHACNVRRYSLLLYLWWNGFEKTFSSTMNSLVIHNLSTLSKARDQRGRQSVNWPIRSLYNSVLQKVIVFPVSQLDGYVLATRHKPEYYAGHLCLSWFDLNTIFGVSFLNQHIELLFSGPTPGRWLLRNALWQISAWRERNENVDDFNYLNTKRQT